MLAMAMAQRAIMCDSDGDGQGEIIETNFGNKPYCNYVGVCGMDDIWLRNPAHISPAEY